MHPWKVKSSVLFMLSLLLLILYFANSDKYKAPTELTQNDLLQRQQFGDFLGINSVREGRKSWIYDQYRVINNHRVFGMDSYLFSGEEIVIASKRPYFKVDLSKSHDKYPQDIMGFNPAKGAQGFNFDEFLFQMKSAGLNSIPVVARNLLYANVSEDSMVNIWQIPVDEGGESSDPLSYRAYASLLFQFAARYGRNKLQNEGGTIPQSLIKVNSANEIKAGLDLIEGIEPGNEMDKDWFTAKEEANPEELAAFLSAIIDGHMGLMGPGHGILPADSSLKIVFPSPTEIKSDYVVEVLSNLKDLRADANERGYETIPYENMIFTAHAYPFADGSGNERSTSVEKTTIFERSYDFIKRIRSITNSPIFLTEIGYDKAVSSPIGVPTNNYDHTDSFQLSPQAHSKHLLRTIFTCFAAGYDRTYIFTLKDPVLVGQKGYTSKFSTTGLIGKDGSKYQFWKIMSYLQKRLASHKLTYAYVKQPVNCLLLENYSERVLVLWSGTNNNSSYSIEIPENLIEDNRFSIVRFDSQTGLYEECYRTDKQVSIEVDEYPKLLILPR